MAAPAKVSPPADPVIAAVPGDTKGERAIANFRAANPNIVFLMARSKNQNVVIYEALRGADKALEAKKPIDVYWMDIDPAYVTANRKKGKMTDRDGLNVIEQKMAYGVSSTPVAGSPGVFKLTLVALPSREVFLALTAEGVARVTMKIGQIVGAIVDRIYVHSVERTLLPPKVEYVEIFGTAPDGTPAYEKCNP